MDPDRLHLDQGESAAFLRQLEDIDTIAYKRRYPALKARQIVKTFISVAAWADLYTWREWDQLGTYAVINDHADDLPSVDVKGQEFSQTIKDLGNSYSYSIKEILKSIATGVNLDSMRAETSRTAIEQGIDDILTTGIPELKIQGVLTLDSTALPASSRVGTYTLSTKTAGGISWGTLAAPNASGQEMANDVIGVCSQVIDDTQSIWDSFDVVMPVAQYNLMRATRLNPLTTTTALEFALSDPSVRSVTPWTKCKGKGAGGTNRMMVLPSGDGMVLGGIVPREWTPGQAQLINLAYKVNAYASCGGVVSRYPIACRYADGQ
jgi:hypothetical protein